MSKKVIIATITFISICLLPTISKAANTVDLTFKFVTINTIDGYDHLSKLIVYCDDKKVSESSQKKQSESNKLIVPIPAGYHTIRATLYALHEGNWEPRMVSNDYSFDFEYVKTKNWESNHTINLTFDIEDEMVKIVEKKLENSATTITTPNTQTGNYKDALKKINAYLKTFDNGYYGYLEVIDGYLYDRFASGKYSKVKISDIDVVTVEEANRKVVMNCKYDDECVYSTYTDSYHTKNSFSQTTDFNTKELVDLLNNFFTSYNGTSQTTSTTKNTNTSTTKVSNNSILGAEQKAADIRAKKEKERKQQNTSTTDGNFKANSTITPNTPRETTTKSSKSTSNNYITALNKLNAYLKTFNPETYDKVEVKDGKVYFYFKVYTMVYNSSISINDLVQNTTILNAKSVGEFGKTEIKILCKNEKKYFYSTYSKGEADHFRFFSNTVTDLSTIEYLVKDLVKALK